MSGKTESSILVGRTVDSSPTAPSTPSPSPPRPPPPVMTYMTQEQNFTAVPAPCTWSFTTGTCSAFRPAEYFAQMDCQIQEPKKKSLLEAYMLALPLGWLGMHHFYLGRPGFGVLYFFSLGLMGAGYVIDLVRLPCLVSEVNKRARERAEQVRQLQQRHQEQQTQGRPVTVIYRVYEPRNLADAYVLWFPCGLFGFHQFYLRNYGMGVLYLCTVGLFGIGWLVDAFRMPSLVKAANEAGSRVTFRENDQCTAHILALSPLGIMGCHHYYLDRPVWGVLYTFTLGLLGVGWVWDWFRVNMLVRRANSIQRGETPAGRKHLDDAYVLCFPFGFTGLHHFYLNRPGWGCLYFFTFGLLGIGWVIDWFRLPCLVKDSNNKIDEAQGRLLGNGFGVSQGGYVNHGGAGGVAVVVSLHQTGPTPQGLVPPQGAPTAPAYDAYPGGYPGYQSGYPAGVSYSGPYPSYVMAPHFAVGNPDLSVPGQRAMPFAPPSYEASMGTAGQQASQEVVKKALE